MYYNIIFIFLFLVAFIPLFYFVTGYQDGATFWEDFYAKQITYMINNAEPGMEFEIDLSKLSKIALENGKDYRSIVSIDNINNIVFVSVREGAGTSFRFFKDLDVVGLKTEISPGKVVVTKLTFKVEGAQRDVEI